MVVKTGDDARQGVTGHGLRYVLLVSLALAIVAMSIVGMLF